MAVPWPDDVPHCPLAGTFREQRAPSVIRSDTEVGPGKARRRSTAINVPTDMSVAMNTAQKETFDLFFDEDIAGGALPFEMKHPVGGAWHLWRFREAPAFSRQGPKWIAQLALTRLD